MLTADVVIIGGGIIGCSVAYYLLGKQPGLKVVLLEKEEVAGLGATSKATGGIRCQFSTPVQVEMSRFGVEVYRQFEELTGQPIGYRQNGYLFVASDPDKWSGLQAAVATQNACGVPTRLVTPGEAGQLIPGLRTDDLLGGSFGPWDGSGNPSDALQGYLTQARARGLETRYMHRVVGFDTEGGRIRGVRTDRDEYSCGAAVLAAGAWAKQVAALAEVDLPVEPYRRQIFTFEPHQALPLGLPMLVDLGTGWYMHQEVHGRLLMGGTDRVARHGLSEAVDVAGLPILLEAAVRRLPCLEEAGYDDAYAGIRALTPDDHAIMGEVPELAGLWLAVGFGGHGFMHAPAAGCALAEAVADGQATCVDISPLSITRFRDGKLLHEVNAF